MQYLDLHAVSLIITKREPEEEEFELSKRDEDIYVIKTFIRKRREKKTNKLGKISYSEWKEIPNSKREIKEMLGSHEEKQFHQLIKKYEEDKYLVECYQSQKRKVYHMSNGELKELEWENFGDIDIQRTKLNPIESYYEYKNKIIKYDCYKKHDPNNGLIIAAGALGVVPIVRWIAGIPMAVAGSMRTKTIYKYKQEKYKRKVNKYSTGYIEKGEWVFDDYNYFENSDPEYDTKH